MNTRRLASFFLPQSKYPQWPSVVSLRIRPGRVPVLDWVIVSVSCGSSPVLVPYSLPLPLGHRFSCSSYVHGVRLILPLPGIRWLWPVLVGHEPLGSISNRSVFRCDSAPSRFLNAVNLYPLFALISLILLSYTGLCFFRATLTVRATVLSLSVCPFPPISGVSVCFRCYRWRGRAANHLTEGTFFAPLRFST